MGLLDDAIREHLDLKRRRGADPTEVERAEREALGPVRRGSDEPRAFDEGAAAHPEELEPEADELFTAGPDEHLDSESRGALEPGFDDPFAEEPPVAPADRERDPAPPVGIRLQERGEEFDHEDEFEHEQAALREERPPEPPEATRRVETLDEETAEYEVESEFDKEHEGDDVLEETPEFLQDAPEHDRLWFEQRPPRDFDFDG